MKRETESRIAGIIRMAVVVALVGMQVLFIFFLTRGLRQNAVYLYLIIEVIAIATIFALASENKNSAYTIAWILVISFLPVFGFLLYVMWGRSDTKGKQHEKVRQSIAYGSRFLQRDEERLHKLGEEYPARKQIMGYLHQQGFPVCENTSCTYYPLGELQFDAVLADMEKAQKCIFICTFILESGKLWERYYDMMVKKAAQGVEVRFMFDDLGSITTVPVHLERDLASKGIQMVRFAPVHRFVSQLHINYRNHQKITVIDGNIAYTGGTNLADEYANYYAKHGHWKDTAIRMEGEAAWSLTVNFLQMWDSQGNTHSDYEAYRPTVRVQAPGYYQPFADGPVNNPDNPAEITYRNMIAGARDYVYIFSPYLVIDNTMRDLLCAAAQAGVDVRIVTPHIYDHWYVHMVTRSNYGALLAAGVRIYEYTPGFIHAKTVVSDDEHCVTGSINMDYRSFDLHYENGVWICGAPIIGEIKEDFLQVFEVSRQVELAEWFRRPWYTRFIERILRVFAVLM